VAGHANDERRKTGVPWRVGMAGSHRKNGSVRFCFTALPAAMSKYWQIGSVRTRQIERRVDGRDLLARCKLVRHRFGESGGCRMSRFEAKQCRSPSCYCMWQRFSVRAINAPIMNAIARSTMKTTMRIHRASNRRSRTIFRQYPD
jgi:hypothetical protein